MESSDWRELPVAFPRHQSIRDAVWVAIDVLVVLASLEADTSLSGGLGNFSSPIRRSCVGIQFSLCVTWGRHVEME